MVDFLEIWGVSRLHNREELIQFWNAMGLRLWVRVGVIDSPVVDQCVK